MCCYFVVSCCWLLVLVVVPCLSYVSQMLISACVLCVIRWSRVVYWFVLLSLLSSVVVGVGAYFLLGACSLVAIFCFSSLVD